MFSSRIKLALCILHELAKEENAGVKMTVARLKERLGPFFTTREATKVVRDLCDASLAGYEWYRGEPSYFYHGETAQASLYDLIIAVEGLSGLGEELAADFLTDIPEELTTAAFIEERLAFETGEALKKIPLAWFLPENASLNSALTINLGIFESRIENQRG